VREVEKTLAMEGVEDEGSASHSRLEALVAAHRGVIIISMQVLSCAACAVSLVHLTAPDNRLQNSVVSYRMVSYRMTLYFVASYSDAQPQTDMQYHPQ
jgi:hypothetical protein